MPRFSELQITKSYGWQNRYNDKADQHHADQYFYQTGTGFFFQFMHLYSHPLLPVQIFIFGFFDNVFKHFPVIIIQLTVFNVAIGSSQ